MFSPGALRPLTRDTTAYYATNSEQFIILIWGRDIVLGSLLRQEIGDVKIQKMFSKTQPVPCKGFTGCYHVSKLIQKTSFLIHGMGVL